MSVAVFPRHVFPLTDDPAFDALDFGVSGRLLVKGGAFALQNAEGLALDLAAAGPLTRVCGPCAPSAPTHSLQPLVRSKKKKGDDELASTKNGPLSGEKRARSGGKALDKPVPDEDGEFGDDERDAGEPADLIPMHMQEGNRGNLACSVQDHAGRVFLVHAGGKAMCDLDVSRLKPCRRGRSWQLLRAARDADVRTARMAIGKGYNEGADRATAKEHFARRLVQITAESHDHPNELAWIAARSHYGAAFYRLNNGPAREENSMQLTAVGQMRACQGATVSSVVLNPHWGGEAALLDSTGHVDLWSAGSETSVRVGGPGTDTQAFTVLIALTEPQPA